MIIPEYLRRPDMTADEKKRLIAWIETKREKMRKAPVFEDESAATKAAVKAFKDGTFMPTVWKQPRDIGQKHVVVEMGLREDAQISGYSEVVDFQKIVDLAGRRSRDIDEIEEV